MKNCENCKRFSSCKRSGEVCRNYREAVAVETVSAIAYAERIGGEVESVTAEEWFGEGDVRECIVRRFPVVYGSEYNGNRQKFCAYPYLVRGTTTPGVSMADDWRGEVLDRRTDVTIRLGDFGA